MGFILESKCNECFLTFGWFFKKTSFGWFFNFAKYSELFRCCDKCPDCFKLNLFQSNGSNVCTKKELDYWYAMQVHKWIGWLLHNAKGYWIWIYINYFFGILLLLGNPFDICNVQQSLFDDLQIKTLQSPHLNVFEFLFLLGL